MTPGAAPGRPGRRRVRPAAPWPSVCQPSSAHCVRDVPRKYPPGSSDTDDECACYVCIVQLNEAPATPDLATALFAVMHQVRRAPARRPGRPVGDHHPGQPREHATLRLSDLAGHLCLDVSTVSRHARTLEDRGYVARADDPADGRAVQLTLTESGRAVLEAAFRNRQAWLDRSLADWSAAERDDLARTLAKLADALGPDRRLVRPTSTVAGEHQRRAPHQPGVLTQRGRHDLHRPHEVHPGVPAVGGVAAGRTAGRRPGPARRRCRPTSRSHRCDGRRDRDPERFARPGAARPAATGCPARASAVIVLRVVAGRVGPALGHAPRRAVRGPLAIASRQPRRAARALRAARVDARGGRCARRCRWPPSTRRPPSTRPPPTPVETTMPSTWPWPRPAPRQCSADRHADRVVVQPHRRRRRGAARAAGRATGSRARPGCSAGTARPRASASGRRSRRRCRRARRRPRPARRVDQVGQRRQSTSASARAPAGSDADAAAPVPSASTMPAAILVPPMSTARTSGVVRPHPPKARIEAVKPCRWLRPPTGPISPPAKKPATRGGAEPAPTTVSASWSARAEQRRARGRCRRTAAHRARPPPSVRNRAEHRLQLVVRGVGVADLEAHRAADLDDVADHDRAAVRLRRRRRRG